VWLRCRAEERAAAVWRPRRRGRSGGGEAAARRPAAKGRPQVEQIDCAPLEPSGQANNLARPLFGLPLSSTWETWAQSQSAGRVRPIRRLRSHNKASPKEDAHLNSAATRSAGKLRPNGSGGRNWARPKGETSFLSPIELGQEWAAESSFRAAGTPLGGPLGVCLEFACSAVPLTVSGAVPGRPSLAALEWPLGREKKWPPQKWAAEVGPPTEIKQISGEFVALRSFPTQHNSLLAHRQASGARH